MRRGTSGDQIKHGHSKHFFAGFLLILARSSDNKLHVCAESAANHLRRDGGVFVDKHFVFYKVGFVRICKGNSKLSSA